jgi:hypothetical protein
MARALRVMVAVAVASSFSFILAAEQGVKEPAVPLPAADPKKEPAEIVKQQPARPLGIEDRVEAEYRAMMAECQKAQGELAQACLRDALVARDKALSRNQAPDKP